MSVEWVFDGAETRFSFPHDVDANAIFIQGRYRYVYSNGDEGQWEECSSNAPVINASSVEDWARIEFDLELSVEDKDRHLRLVMHENDPAYAGVFGINTISSSGTTYQSRTRFWKGGVQGEVGASLKLKLSKKDHAGEILLQPRSVLGESLGRGIRDRKARRRGSILATGAPLQIRVDPPKSMPGSDITHTWANFGDKYCDALTELVVDEEGEIRCYWNNEFKELKAVIMSTTRTGKMAAWREAIFAPQRVNFVKQLTAWAAQYDAEDGFGAEKLAEKFSPAYKMD